MITISRSSPFRNSEVTPFVKESLNSIEIVDDLGNRTPLFADEEPGVYRTFNDFAAVEGRTYVLRFETNGGVSYESRPQTVPPAGRIDNVYFNYEISQIYNSEFDQFVDRGGLQISADYSYPSQESFMAFDWEGTYIFKADGGFQTCYVPDQQPGIAPIVNNRAFNTLSFEDQDLFFFNHTFKFRFKYSVNVLLYSMDEAGYNFLTDVESQLNSTGSIFDPAPKQLKGNIFNPNNESEIVLGYFGVFNVTSSRIFISAGQIPAPPAFDICSRGGPGFPPNYCFDCTELNGSTEEEPSYWE